MAIIVTVNAGEPLAGNKYEIAGTLASRSGDLATAIARELGINPAAVNVVAPDVFVDGRSTLTLSEGILDKPVNNKIAILFRNFIHTHEGDRDTIVMVAFKSCIRYAKKVRGMSKAQLTNLIGSLYDAIDSTND